MKRIVPVDLSRMMQMNGLSALKTGVKGSVTGISKPAAPHNATAEAAAASVPSSFTSTKALWNISEMYS